MAVLISFYIVPLSEGTSISRYVKEVVRLLKEKKVKFMVTPASTIIEVSDVGEGLKTIAEVHEKIMSMGVKRMVTVIKIDDRRDKELSLNIMVDKVNKIISEFSDQ